MRLFTDWQSSRIALQKLFPNFSTLVLFAWNFLQIRLKNLIWHAIHYFQYFYKFYSKKMFNHFFVQSIGVLQILQLWTDYDEIFRNCSPIYIHVWDDTISTNHNDIYYNLRTGPPPHPTIENIGANNWIAFYK